jgi:putative cell wall-binding protein
MDCTNLTDVNVSSANKTYSSQGGVLYNKAKTILYRCPTHKSSVTIPSSVTKIGYTAFSYNNALRSIYIPNNIKTIDRYAFNECSELTSVILTNGITEIPECAFYGCGKLRSISIPRGVKKIGSEAFMTCRDLTTVNIPDSVTFIGALAFKYTSVKDIYIPSSVIGMTTGDILDGGITVYGQKNTTAQTYAQKYGHTFKEIPTALARFAGAGRYDTAKTISVEGSVASGKTVVLAYGLNYADALAGVPLASSLGAPILLTAKDTLPEETLGEIKRLGANKVIILGGETAVSKSVENTLKNNSIAVERLAGDTRFGTATKIAKQLNTAPSEIFFVYGFNYADALSVSTVAAVKKAPVIYLKTNGEIDAQTAAYLKSVKDKVKNAYVIGGEGVISNSMMTAAANALGLKAGTTVKRIAGKNRYATCVEVNTSFSSVLTGKAMCIAKGLDFPDALAGGVFAAKNKAPLLLADKALTTEQKAFIKQKKATKLYIFGAAGAVPNSLVQSISSL